MPRHHRRYVGRRSPRVAVAAIVLREWLHVQVKLGQNMPHLLAVFAFQIVIQIVKPVRAAICRTGQAVELLWKCRGIVPGMLSNNPWWEAWWPVSPVLGSDNHSPVHLAAWQCTGHGWVYSFALLRQHNLDGVHRCGEVSAFSPQESLSSSENRWKEVGFWAADQAVPVTQQCACCFLIPQNVNVNERV